jgi:DNA mismatch repair protein MutL
VKFESDRNIYAILLASVKESLGKFNAVPSLDFNRPEGFDIDVVTSSSIISPPSIKINPKYNPFDDSTTNKNGPAQKIDFESFYKLDEVIAETNSDSKGGHSDEAIPKNTIPIEHLEEDQVTNFLAYQYNNAYILTTLKTGLIIIDQFRAHFRILFEQIKSQLNDTASFSQKLLFPITFTVSPKHYLALQDSKVVLEKLGFIIDWQYDNKLLISGIPSSLDIHDPISLLQNLADHLVEGNNTEIPNIQEYIAFNFANQLSIRKGKKLHQEEIDAIIDDLFSCNNPYFSPHGKPIMFKLTLEEIQNRFEK